MIWKLSLPMLINFPFIVLNGGDFGHMMDMDHMMDWWGVPSMGFWMVGIWIVFVIIAVLVYKDAQDRNMNGLLWLFLVILPWIGILFLIIYLIIREQKSKQPLSQNNAIDVLDKRYAKGEISRDEYQQMKKDIENKK